MSALGWIVASGIAMSLLALVGAVVLVLSPTAQDRLLRPLVAFSAGALLGGAMFHMLPSALEQAHSPLTPFVWAMLGFTAFFALEQFLHWHHCKRAHSECRRPVATLVLLGDGLHNLLGGLAVGGTFLVDIRLGITTWLAAAAHEIPQELGDFAVLVHAGLGKTRALLANIVSASTFLIGGLIAYGASAAVDVSFLVPLAAGNFIYIAASDLVPEVNRHTQMTANFIHFAAFAAGAALLLAVRLTLE